MLIRNICVIDHCNALGRITGKDKKGRKMFGSHCDRHHRMKYPGPTRREGIINTKCEMCGWNEALCDRHRIIPEKGYVKDNVIILCPNCHRKVTLGVMQISGNAVS